MEIRHLRYFVSVADTGNFTRAAELCHVAQSALSQQIARLEREAGAPLFVRTTRSVELTPAGRVLMPLARRILADEISARAELRSFLGLEKGRLRIGLIQTSTHFPETIEAITAFHERFDGIELTITSRPSEAMVEEIASGDLDIAVVASDPSRIPDALSSVILREEPLVGILRTADAVGLQTPTDITDLLARGRLIRFARGSGIRHRVDDAVTRAGGDPQPSAGIELTQVTDLIRFTQLGLGVTIVPASLAKSVLGEPGDSSHDGTPACTVVALTDPDAVHTVRVVHDPRRMPPAAAEFLRLLVPPPSRARRSSATPQ
ncbi:LysR substrate-binding domain-containing protein [Gordonia jinhuaensis]|uniref:LysR family transcriptional regulator n=1 Tax=Gordonia jinhuaensis TaxID=1517702 RepID=A0A916SW52_9ACTN|nr:LysR family transcriptional regulator [Gordonia jinhuaensis]GGB16954.1 LysR family transcriptional regulator [Gordonia jinhuaensis]